ncbi:hypothetical protein WME91_26160 [Sorangium sp. So ce269]
MRDAVRLSLVSLPWARRMGDADITLRHLARRRPEDLVRAFVPGGRSIEVLGWVDSQVTNIERRLDKALCLRIDGEPRVLHVEFCFALRDNVPDRVFEYVGFLFAALRLEAPDEPVPPIESVAVVLSGRRRRLPATGRRRIAWPGRPFSGAHFRIDAVYQRTVGELRARGSVPWLVFAPLARNATAAALREVVAEIHAGAATAEEQVLPSRLADGTAPRLDDGHLAAARQGLMCVDGHRGRCPDVARRDGHRAGHRPLRRGDDHRGPERLSPRGR